MKPEFKVLMFSAHENEAEEPMVAELRGGGFDVIYGGPNPAYGEVKSEDLAGVVGTTAVPAEALLQFCRDLKTLQPHVPCLLCGDDAEEAARFAFLQAGGDEMTDRTHTVQMLNQLVPSMMMAQFQASPRDSGAGAERSDLFMRVKRGDLLNVVQLLTMTNRDGRLQLAFDSTEEQAQLFIDSGRTVHASFKGEDGIAALAHMLAAGEAEAHFFEGEAADQVTLTGTVDSILIEASVLSDEMGARDAGQ